MESLIADWYKFASLSMLDDGEITWFAKNEEPLAITAFSQFERRCEVDVRRVKKRRNADIRIVRRRKLIDGYSAGRANWSAATGFGWKIEVIREIEGYEHHETTVVHEIGHALGLDHPDDHAANRKTMMSYQRDSARIRWYRQDIANFNEIYNPDLSDKITNPYGKSSVIDSDSMNRVVSHATDQISVDYITGVHHHPHR